MVSDNAGDWPDVVQQQEEAMSWDRKGRGAVGGYFYRSVRTPSGVKKVYLGRGTAAVDAALALERRCKERELAQLGRLAERTAVEALETASQEIRQWAVALATVWLTAAGYHFHRGEWRRRRV